VQDGSMLVSNFTKDVITYKIRFEFGGAVCDWRGLYRGNS